MDSHDDADTRVAKLQRLAGAAAVDETFRRRLRDDPEGAAQLVGIELDDGDYDVIRKVSQDMDWGALEALGPLLRAALPRHAELHAAWGRVAGIERMPEIVEDNR